VNILCRGSAERERNIDIETTLLQQLLNIAQRKRIAKIPSGRTKYEAGFGLPPFEDRWSGYHSAILSRHQSATLKFATHPTYTSGPDQSSEITNRTWAHAGKRPSGYTG
jgi:hypothetical protein